MYNLNIGLRTPHLGGIRTHNVRCYCLCLFDRGLLLTEKLLKKGFLMVMLNSSLRTLSIRHHNFKNCYGYSPLHEFIVGILIRVRRRVSLVEQELFTLPEHLSSTPIFSGTVVLFLFIIVLPVPLRLLIILLVSSHFPYNCYQSTCWFA